MYEQLKQVVDESGIWKGSRVITHSFLLSESVFVITPDQREELTVLGHALYDCMLGLSHIATIAYDSSLNYGGAWAMCRKVFSSGVPKNYHELSRMNIKDITRLLKVDLMIDASGQFRIAEIDGHNKHGLGYSTLARRLREVSNPESEVLPGAVALLAEEITRMGYRRIDLLYADQEKFYIPEFEIARDELSKYGIGCELIRESDTEGSQFKDGLLLDMPFLYHNVGLYGALTSGYRSGLLKYVIAPKPFMGAKGVLAILANSGANTEMEALLSSFIKKGSLAIVRKYLPETYLVGKGALSIDEVRDFLTEKSYVLKESISSGMKGTMFSSDRDFPRALRVASNSSLNWILQEEVENLPFDFQFYENKRGVIAGKKTNDWFTRVTVHYVGRKLADVTVTGRRDKAVHGAPDCVMLGTIIKENGNEEV